MSGVGPLQERIEQVLREHRWALGGCLNRECRAAWTPTTPMNQARHHAEVVLAALELSPEWARGWDGKDGKRKHGTGYPTRDEAAVTGSTSARDPIEVRWCTGWEPA